MFVRKICPFACAVLVIVSYTACDRPASPPSAPPTGATVSPVVSSLPDVSTIHWVGKRRLAADTNAASVMSLLNLPESGELAEQTLDKLALAPWRLLKNDDATNGAPTALLRPLLDDLVAEESQWTFFHPTNGGGGWSVAIRLPGERAGLWQTNLTAVFESLTGGKAETTAAGFTLKQQYVVSFQLPGSNGLTTLTVAKTGVQLPAASPEPATNWLSFSLDLAAINRAYALGWTLPANCPRANLRLIGLNQMVQTRGSLDFAKPLKPELGNWSIPTNVIRDPIVGFTAVRGLSNWLSPVNGMWHEGLGAPPNQVYSWTVSGINLMSYFAAPVPGAQERLKMLNTHLLSIGNGWLMTNGMGYFSRIESGSPGVAWVGVPFMAPFLSATPDNAFLYGGFFPLPRTTNPLPREIVIQLESRTNLVYYDWELTGARADAYVDVGQLVRSALLRPQVPTTNAMAWLLAGASKLGNCTTSMVLDDHGDLQIYRNSTVGITALELHLIADWVASPDFPLGLHTFRVNLPERIRALRLESRGTLPRSAQP